LANQSVDRGAMNKQQILDEIEDLFRSMPEYDAFRLHIPNAIAWAGRAKALLKKWDPIESMSVHLAINNALSENELHAYDGYTKLTVLVQQARHDLLLETVGPRSIAIAGGAVFDYFDEIRKIAETAKADLFFIDPYLNADFVSRYLKTIPSSVSMRLLGSKPAEMASLVPSVEALCKQNGSKISVRSTPQLHDRYVFVDNMSCYQSGSSFKDGAKKSPVVITQIIDAFAAVQVTYENLWSSAKVEL
jgi:hypothetical protein